jgi:hypothetical protein
MDYARKILNFVRKYHFWLLAVLVVVLVAVFWTSASARFSENFQKRKSDILQDIDNMHKLAGMSDPVNEMVYTAIRNVHEQLRNNVMRGWRYLHKQQQENNRLPEVLGDRFKKEWEKREEHGWNEELSADVREHYWNFIERHFPNLLDDAKIRRPKKAELLAGGMTRGVTGPTEGALAPTGAAEQIEYEGIVVWEETNYQQFLARFHWDRLPSTQKVRLAQEDLWVYKTLLDIIKELNKGATSHYNAMVKRIFALDIAQYATKAFYEARDALGLRSLGGVGPGGAGAAGGVPGEVGPPVGPPQPGGAPAAPGPAMSEGPVPGAAMPPGATPGTPPGMLEGPGMGPAMHAPGTSELDQLYAYRYVDQNEQPVPVENGVPKHPFSEFKMMPIRMRLLMDQRKIPELLAFCANSKMPIEVRQVRINPGRAAKVNYGAGRSSIASPMMPGAGPIMEGVGPMGPAGPGAGPTGSGLEGLWTPPISAPMGTGLSMTGPGAGETFYQGPYDLVVEILGIIYIYEPPDEKKLGTGAAVAQPPSAEPDPSESPTAPAPTPGEQPASPAPPSGPVGPGGIGPTAPAVPPAATPSATPPEAGTPVGTSGPGSPAGPGAPGGPVPAPPATSPGTPPKADGPPEGATVPASPSRNA